MTLDRVNSATWVRGYVDQACPSFGKKEILTRRTWPQRRSSVDRREEPPARTKRERRETSEARHFYACIHTTPRCMQQRHGYVHARPLLSPGVSVCARVCVRACRGTTRLVHPRVSARTVRSSLHGSRYSPINICTWGYGEISWKCATYRPLGRPTFFRFSISSPRPVTLFPCIGGSC